MHLKVSFSDIVNPFYKLEKITLKQEIGLAKLFYLV